MPTTRTFVGKDGLTHEHKQRHGRAMLIVAWCGQYPVDPGAEPSWAPLLPGAPTCLRCITQKAKPRSPW